MENLVDVKNDGSIHLNMKYFSFTYDKVMTNQKFSDLFGIPPRKEDSKAEQIHYDIAASAQLVLEDILLKMVNHVHKKTGMANLCFGGGVALNGVANYRILKDGPFENIHIPPSPGDGGSAVGCAQYLYYCHDKNKRMMEDNVEKIKNNIFVGPSHSNSEIKSFLDINKIDYKFLETNSLLQTVAKLIVEGNVVGWYQGKMEWGPRALGNRSIIADPRNAKMKDILNEKIKHRESFRPFAPSILEEYVSEYFDIDITSPYMLLVAPVKKPEKIPAVTHVDGTGRLQTVSKQSNPLYLEWLKIQECDGVLPLVVGQDGTPFIQIPTEKSRP